MSQFLKRRSILEITLLSAFSMGTVAHLMFRRKKSREKKNHASGIRKPLGTPLVLPPNQDVVWSSCFSSNGKKLVLVCGDITKKSVYCTDFPVKNQDSYRLIKSFNNCYKIDGISIMEGKDIQIALRKTDFQLDTILSGIQTPEDWRKACQDHNINKSSFFGSLLVIDANGEQKMIEDVAASNQDSITASTTWISEESLWFLDCENQLLSNFDLSPNSKENIPLENSAKLKQISYNSGQGLLFAIGSGQQIGMSALKNFQITWNDLNQYIEGVANNGFLCLDSGGSSFVLQTDQALFKYNFEERSTQKRKIRKNESTDFRMASLSSSGIVVLAYINKEAFEKEGRILTELRTLKFA